MEDQIDIVHINSGVSSLKPITLTQDLNVSMLELQRSSNLPILDLKSEELKKSLLGSLEKYIHITKFETSGYVSLRGDLKLYVNPNSKGFSTFLSESQQFYKQEKVSLLNSIKAKDKLIQCLNKDLETKDLYTENLNKELEGIKRLLDLNDSIIAGLRNKVSFLFNLNFFTALLFFILLGYVFYVK
mgnify:CR=1 FL=1|jgi:hypothetical protein